MCFGGDVSGERERREWKGYNNLTSVFYSSNVNICFAKGWTPELDSFVQML